MSKESKKRLMGNKVGVVAGVGVAAAVLVVGVAVWQMAQGPLVKFRSPEEIQKMAETADFDGYEMTMLNPAGEETGNLAETVRGEATAPVKVFAYVDYMVAPDYNAVVNEILNQIVEKYDGKVAVVTRGYVSGGETESATVAAAVEAAAIQGYGQKYKDLLHEEYENWSGLEGRGLQKELEEAFMRASERKGDREKFRKDMGSEEVLKKLVFNQAMAAQTDRGNLVTVFFVNDEKMAQDNGENFTELMLGLVEKKLAEAEGSENA